jgi:hypothetical protein
MVLRDTALERLPRVISSRARRLLVAGLLVAGLTLSATPQVDAQAAAPVATAPAASPGIMIRSGGKFTLPAAATPALPPEQAAPETDKAADKDKAKPPEKGKPAEADKQPKTVTRPNKPATPPDPAQLLLRPDAAGKVRARCASILRGSLGRGSWSGWPTSRR